MATKQHNCETCSKICEESKIKVKQLEKKVFALTIVVTSAVTLLGEQAANALLSSLKTTSEAIEIVEKKNTETSSSEVEKKGDLELINQKQSFNFKSKNNIKKYQLTDELAASSAKNNNTSEQIVPISFISSNFSEPFKTVENQVDSDNSVSFKSFANQIDNLNFFQYDNFQVPTSLTSQFQYDCPDDSKNFGNYYTTIPGPSALIVGAFFFNSYK